MMLHFYHIFYFVEFFEIWNTQSSWMNITFQNKYFKESVYPQTENIVQAYKRFHPEAYTLSTWKKLLHVLSWIHRSSQLLSRQKGDQNMERVCILNTFARIQKHIGMRLTSPKDLLFAHRMFLNIFSRSLFIDTLIFIL